MRDLKSNQMRFLSYSSAIKEDLIEVTAVAHSPNKKYIAVGYVKSGGDKKCYIAVHNVKNAGQKVKLAVTIDLFEGGEPPAQQRSVIALSFSMDNKQLVATLDNSTMMVYRWSVESASTGTRSSKLMVSKEFTDTTVITKVAFHPNDRSILLVMGPSYLQQYYIIEDEMEKSEFSYNGIPSSLSLVDFDFTDSNHLLISTKQGKVVIFQNFDVL